MHPANKQILIKTGSSETINPDKVVLGPASPEVVPACTSNVMSCHVVRVGRVYLEIWKLQFTVGATNAVPASDMADVYHGTGISCRQDVILRERMKLTVDVGPTWKLSRRQYQTPTVAKGLDCYH